MIDHDNVRNSGNRNSGSWNSGNRNSGDGNSGYRNSGSWSSGSWNSGNRNSGDFNSGYGNSCDRNSGIFCTESPQIFSFNKPTSKKWQEINHPLFSEFCLTKWVCESEMSDAEKIENKDFHERGGYLKTYSYKEAWANYWRDCDGAEKQRVLNLPNFDADIFREITGIDVNCKTVSCAGKIVEIEGKKYRLVEE